MFSDGGTCASAVNRLHSSQSQVTISQISEGTAATFHTLSAVVKHSPLVLGFPNYMFLSLEDFKR